MSGLFVGAILLLLALPGLLASEPPGPSTTTTDPSAYDLYDFQGGATRIVAGFPFSVGAHLVEVEGSEVRVYQYRTADHRQGDSDTIAMNGWSINNTPVEWAAQPHIWVRGTIIVMYLGSDRRVIDAISERVESDAVFPQGGGSD